MSKLESPVITPDWTLRELQERCPGVELTLFSHFGIGSRERSGFSGKEILSDLLRRHLVFDAQRACARLTELAQEDWAHAWTAPKLSLERDSADLVVVDARGRDEFELCPLGGTSYLSGELVSRLSPADHRLIFVCNDGSQAPAASRLLRKQGFRAFHLAGGLLEWSRRVDATFPILFPLNEEPGHWYLLADGRTLRYRFPEPRPTDWRQVGRADLEATQVGRILLETLPEIEAVYLSPRSFAVRGDFLDLHRVVEAIPSAVLTPTNWQGAGEESSENREAATIEAVLRDEAPEILANHKGTVVARSYQDRVLTLALGGGCSGCASAQVTTQRELAALLYRRVPLLDRIESSE